MNIQTNTLFFALLTALAFTACESKKQQASNHSMFATLPDTLEKAPVALLTKTTYPLGSQIPVRFAKPATNVRIQWDGIPVPIAVSQPDSVLVPSKVGKTGFHQLIISGIAGKDAFADTLAIELLANIVPQDRQYSVLKTYPHQSGSFTEGLEFYKGALYESTGLNGESHLLKVDLETGKTLKTLSLPAQYFGEGITIVRDKIYQLTWTTGVGFRYNLDFKQEKTFTYYTQGWGLTHHDTTLIMSDGSNKLYFFNPDFQKKSELAVYDNKGPVTNLNELEYVDGYIFANIWQTKQIAQIDPASGMVIAYMDMDRLVPANVDAKENVLNGIAYQSQENILYVTGKNWPTLTKIRLNSLVRTKQKTLASLN